MLIKTFIEQCAEYLAGYKEYFLNVTNSVVV